MQYQDTWGWLVLRLWLLQQVVLLPVLLNSLTTAVENEEPVVTFSSALFETATGHEIISRSLVLWGLSWYEFLGRKLGDHMHAITKDGIYTANRNIGNIPYTDQPHLRPACRFSIVHQKKWLIKNRQMYVHRWTWGILDAAIEKKILQNFMSSIY